jgi:hypothetical protein
MHEYIWEQCGNDLKLAFQKTKKNKKRKEGSKQGSNG